MKNDFDELIRTGRDADALRHLADEYYKNGKMGHTRKLLLERAADRIDQLEQTWEWDMYKAAQKEIERLRKELAESQRREQAAIEDFTSAAINGNILCEFCGADCIDAGDDTAGDMCQCGCFVWRGAQEKGE